MSLRMDKINREIQRQVMSIIQEEIDDPNLGIFSIVKVETTSDLAESKIYFSLLDDSKYSQVKVILNKMNSFIRLNLGRRMRLRVLPVLRFIPDDTIKYSIHIHEKIEEIKKENNRKDDQKNY
ncbi:MAG: 30S ribosome-binding factor RbfA [Candidatus Omnitrophica bacterium]|nr:30S ribosome-binding factor RbfA [Candidatus Omnitrophota bacterium]